MLSLTRDSHPTANAIEQPDPKILFELADLSPEGWLAHPKPRGCLGEAPGVGDGDEVAEVPKVHE